MKENETKKEDRRKQIAFLNAHDVLEKYFSEKTQKEKIAFLADAGFSNDDIATLVKATPKAVSVRLSEYRKKKK